MKFTTCRYIIDNYDNLPDMMLFIHSQRYQWHNDDPYYDGVPMLRNFQTSYLLKEGYVNLRCVWTLGCPVEIHPLSDIHREDVHAGEYFKLAFMELFPDTPVPEEVGVSCCAQFGVTRDRVLMRPKSDYEFYRKWLTDTELKDEMSGRIMEYSWHSTYAWFFSPSSYTLTLSLCSDFRQRARPLPKCSGLLLQCLWAVQFELSRTECLR